MGEPPEGKVVVPACGKTGLPTPQVGRLEDQTVALGGQTGEPLPEKTEWEIPLRQTGETEWARAHGRAERKKEPGSPWEGA